MNDLLHSNRWIWQSETFWNCYLLRNGRLFQENVLLKATNTNNNHNMVLHGLHTWDADIAKSCSCRRKCHHKKAPNVHRRCHTDEMHEEEGFTLERPFRTKG